MNSHPMPHVPVDLHSKSPASHNGVEIDAFRWLLILGFPLPIAAATAMPELFTAEEKARARR